MNRSRVRAGLIGLCVSAALGVTGCSTPTTQTPNTPTTRTEASSITSTATATTTQTTTVAPPTSHKAEPEPTQQACDSTTPDPLAHSGVAQGTLYDGVTTYFHYEIDSRKSNFDPCAPISWDVLAGTLSASPDQPGATAGSFNQTVVFFSYGQLIEQPTPPLTATVDAVTVTSPTTVAASFNVDKGPRAAADFLLLTNYYELEDGQIKENCEQISQAPDPAPQLNLSTLAFKG